MKTTRHFEEDILGRDRPYIKREWCERALKEAEYTEEQADGTADFGYTSKSLENIFE